MDEVVVKWEKKKIRGGGGGMKMEVEKQKALRNWTVVTFLFCDLWCNEANTKGKMEPARVRCWPRGQPEEDERGKDSFAIPFSLCVLPLCRRWCWARLDPRWPFQSICLSGTRVAQPPPISILLRSIPHLILKKEWSPITPSAQIQTEETELMVAFSISTIQKGCCTRQSLLMMPRVTLRWRRQLRIDEWLSN